MGLPSSYAEALGNFNGQQILNFNQQQLEAIVGTDHGSQMRKLRKLLEELSTTDSHRELGRGNQRDVKEDIDKNVEELQLPWYVLQKLERYKTRPEIDGAPEDDPQKPIEQESPEIIEVL